MLLCLPSSRFSLISPPTCVFVLPHRLRTEGRPPCARSWKLVTSSSTSTDQPSTAADRKPSSSSRARTGYWSSPSGGEHCNNVIWIHKHTQSYLRTCFFHTLEWLQSTYLIMAMTYSSWKEGEAGGRREVWPSACLTCKHAPRPPRCFTGSNLWPLGCHTESWLW